MLSIIKVIIWDTITSRQVEENVCTVNSTGASALAAFIKELLSGALAEEITSATLSYVWYLFSLCGSEARDIDLYVSGL